MVILHEINPQPVIKETRFGWDISGIPYSTENPEYHLRGDNRFSPPKKIYGGNPSNILSRWIECHDGIYVWLIDLRTEIAVGA